MKRLNPNDLPAALHTAKVLSRLATFLAVRTPGASPARLVRQAAEVLGYTLTVETITAGTDPTVARALALVNKAAGVQS